MTESILVRAPVAITYRTLTDLDAWPRWHSGCRSRRIARPVGTDAPETADHVALVLPDRHRGLRRRPSRLEVAVHGWRHDAGVRWDVRGDVELAVEWWLEPCIEGTLVHHVVHQAVGREVRAVRHRQTMMYAMQAMKDHLELAVALASGRIP